MSRDVRAPAPSANLRAELLGAEAALDRLGADWLRLAREVDTATCFMFPAYFRAWHRVLAGDVTAGVVAVDDGTSLRGVLPVMKARVWRGPSCVPRIDYAPADRCLSPGGWRPVPIRQLASVVSWPAAAIRPTLLCAEADRPAVCRAVAAALAAVPGVDAIVLPVAEGAEADNWSAGFSEAGRQPRMHRLGRCFLSLGALRPFEQIVAGESRNFRRNVRRASLAATAAGIEFAVRVDREAVESLDLLARVARQSWKHSGRADAAVSLPYDGRQRRFFECLLADADSGMTPVLATASAAGEPIAAILAIRHGGNLTGLLTFRSDRDAEASPGLLLLGAVVDWAAANGLRRIDMNATQGWLRHLVDERQMLANLVVFAPTPIGRGLGLLSAAAQAMHAARPRAGRRGPVSGSDPPGA